MPQQDNAAFSKHTEEEELLETGTTFACQQSSGLNVARIGAISELHCLNTLALRPSGPDANLKTPSRSAVVSPMGINGLIHLQWLSESNLNMKAG